MPTMTISEPTKQETTDFFKRLKAQHANKASTSLPSLPTPYFFCYINGQDKASRRRQSKHFSQCQNFLKTTEGDKGEYYQPDDKKKYQSAQRTVDQTQKPAV
jgi:hypothetical protein